MLMSRHCLLCRVLCAAVAFAASLHAAPLQFTALRHVADTPPARQMQLTPFAGFMLLRYAADDADAACLSCCADSCCRQLSLDAAAMPQRHCFDAHFF